MIAYANDIRDIKPPVYFTVSYFLLFILLAIVLVAGLVWLGVIIHKKLKRETTIEPPPKPPHKVAYEALEALRGKNLPGSGMIKEYYSLLSDIIRRYIESRFSIKAPEMTTEEFLLTLRSSDVLTGTQKNLLKEFLSLCDIVKFARYGPTEKEIDTSYNAAKRFVDETKPEVQKPQEVTVS